MIWRQLLTMLHQIPSISIMIQMATVLTRSLYYLKEESSIIKPLLILSIEKCQTTLNSNMTTYCKTGNFYIKD